MLPGAGVVAPAGPDLGLGLLGLLGLEVQAVEPAAVEGLPAVGPCAVVVVLEVPHEAGRRGAILHGEHGTHAGWGQIE